MSTLHINLNSFGDRTQKLWPKNKSARRVWRKIVQVFLAFNLITLFFLHQHFHRKLLKLFRFTDEDYQKLLKFSLFTIETWIEACPWILWHCRWNDSIHGTIIIEKHTNLCIQECCVIFHLAKSFTLYSKISGDILSKSIKTFNGWIYQEN